MWCTPGSGEDEKGPDEPPSDLRSGQPYSHSDDVQMPPGGSSAPLAEAAAPAPIDGEKHFARLKVFQRPLALLMAETPGSRHPGWLDGNALRRFIQPYPAEAPSSFFPSFPSAGKALEELLLRFLNEKRLPDVVVVHIDLADETVANLSERKEPLTLLDYCELLNTEMLTRDLKGPCIMIYADTEEIYSNARVVDAYRRKIIHGVWSLADFSPQVFCHLLLHHVQHPHRRRPLDILSGLFPGRTRLSAPGE